MRGGRDLHIGRERLVGEIGIRYSVCTVKWVSNTVTAMYLAATVS